MKLEKLSAGLLTALHDFDEEGRIGLTRHARTLGVLPSLGMPKPPRPANQCCVGSHAPPARQVEPTAVSAGELLTRPHRATIFTSVANPNCSADEHPRLVGSQ